MSDGAWAIQLAVFALFEGDEILPPFFDAVPVEDALPYGTYGPPISTRQNRLGKMFGSRNVVEINWWSLERENLANGRVNLYGNSLVARYAARCQQLLLSPLVLSEGQVVLLRWEDNTYLPEPERNVRRVRQIFTIDVR